MYKELGMQIELSRNNVYQGVELLLLVSMLFLLAIPKCLLIFKENFYYTSIGIGLLHNVERGRLLAVSHCRGNRSKMVYCSGISCHLSLQLLCTAVAMTLRRGCVCRQCTLSTRWLPSTWTSLQHRLAHIKHECGLCV